MRLNHLVVQKPSHAVKPLDLLTIAIHDDIRVIRVLAEADRRGPAAQASLLYEELMMENKSHEGVQKLGA